MICRFLAFVHLGFVKIILTYVWIFWYFELVDWLKVTKFRTSSEAIQIKESVFFL